MRTNQQSKIRKSACGYTLIEMLVSIAIMGILASIMLPALSKAKAKANRIKCASNLRQMGQGLILFGGETNDRLPWQLTSQGIYGEFLDVSSYNNRQTVLNQVWWIQSRIYGENPNITNPTVNNITNTPPVSNVFCSIPKMKGAIDSAKMLHSPCDPTQTEVSEIAESNWRNYNAHLTSDWRMALTTDSQFIPQMAISYVFVRGGDLARPNTVMASTRNLSGLSLGDSKWVGNDTIWTSTRAMAGLTASQGNMVLADGRVEQASDSDLGLMGGIVTAHMNSRGGISLGDSRTDVFGLD